MTRVSEKQLAEIMKQQESPSCPCFAAGLGELKHRQIDNASNSLTKLVSEAIASTSTCDEGMHICISAFMHVCLAQGWNEAYPADEISPETFHHNYDKILALAEKSFATLRQDLSILNDYCKLLNAN